MKSYIVFAVKKGRSGEAVWLRVGSGQENRDGSLNVYLDALPLDGQLHLRDKASVSPDQAPKKEVER